MRLNRESRVRYILAVGLETLLGVAGKPWSGPAEMRSPEHERQVRVAAELVAVVDRHALDTGPKLLASGDRRGGVVWYTQGSGKSLAMAFYKGDGGADRSRAAMKNPTLVVLTNRNDVSGSKTNAWAWGRSRPASERQPGTMPRQLNAATTTPPAPQAPSHRPPPP